MRLRYSATRRILAISKDQMPAIKASASCIIASMPLAVGLFLSTKHQLTAIEQSKTNCIKIFASLQSQSGATFYPTLLLAAVFAFWQLHY